MFMPPNTSRRQALGTIIGSGVALFAFSPHANANVPIALPLPAATFRKRNGVVGRARFDDSVAFAPEPTGVPNVSQHVLVKTSNGQPYPGVRVDARYRLVGQFNWTYYGAQTSQSNGYARFNPFFLPAGKYEINSYTTTTNNSLIIEI